MLRVLTLVIALIVTANLLTVSAAENQQMQQATNQAYDCISNATGLVLRVTLVSELKTGVYFIAPGQKVAFPVGSIPKTLALVAFEEGSNNLVALLEFQSLPQAYPPTNCYTIVMKAKSVAAERVDESGLAPESEF